MFSLSFCHQFFKEFKNFCTFPVTGGGKKRDHENGQVEILPNSFGHDLFVMRRVTGNPSHFFRSFFTRLQIDSRFGVSLRTFHQRRSLLPLGDTAVTGDTEKSRCRSGGDRPSLSPGGDNECTRRNCPSRAASRQIRDEGSV